MRIDNVGCCLDCKILRVDTPDGCVLSVRKIKDDLYAWVKQRGSEVVEPLQKGRATDAQTTVSMLEAGVNVAIVLG